MSIDPQTIGAFNRQPTNLNFASGLQFKFNIRKIPHVNYFVQRTNIAELTSQHANHPTPLQNLPVPGTTLTYGPLIVTFKIDEDWQNYEEIFKWVNGLAIPKNLQQFARLKKENIELNAEFGGIYSDALLHVLTNKSQPIVNFIYRQAFPVSLNNIQLASDSDNIDYLTCDATFLYSWLDFERVV